MNKFKKSILALLLAPTLVFADTGIEPSGGGAIAANSCTTDNAVLTADGTDGSGLQCQSPTINDSGDLGLVGSVDIANALNSPFVDFILGITSVWTLGLTSGAELKFTGIASGWSFNVTTTAANITLATTSGDIIFNPGGTDTVDIYKASFKESIYETITTVNNAASPYTVLATDRNILCDTSGGAVTLNLPAISGELGRVLSVKRNGASDCTLDGNASEALDGATTLVLGTDYDSYTIKGLATEWGVF